MMAQHLGGAEVAWRERLARFSSSGLTVKAFCAREGVSPSNFYAWKRRLGIGTGSSSPRKWAKNEPLFVPVHLTPVVSTVEVRIVLPGGAVVHVPSEANERMWACCLQSVVVATRAGEDTSC